MPVFVYKVRWTYNMGTAGHPVDALLVMLKLLWYALYKEVQMFLFKQVSKA